MKIIIKIVANNRKNHFVITGEKSDYNSVCSIFQIGFTTSNGRGLICY